LKILSLLAWPLAEGKLSLIARTQNRLCILFPMNISPCGSDYSKIRNYIMTNIIELNIKFLIRIINKRINCQCAFTRQSRLRCNLSLNDKRIIIAQYRNLPRCRSFLRLEVMIISDTSDVIIAHLARVIGHISVMNQHACEISPVSFVRELFPGDSYADHRGGRHRRRGVGRDLRHREERDVLSGRLVVPDPAGPHRNRRRPRIRHYVGLAGQVRAGEGRREYSVSLLPSARCESHWGARGNARARGG